MHPLYYEKEVWYLASIASAKSVHEKDLATHAPSDSLFPPKNSSWIVEPHGNIEQSTQGSEPYIRQPVVIAQK